MAIWAVQGIGLLINTIQGMAQQRQQSAQLAQMQAQTMAQANKLKAGMDKGLDIKGGGIMGGPSTSIYVNYPDQAFDNLHKMQTGNLADPAKHYWRGIELWRDDINAHGGLLGKKMEFVIYDDRSDAATSAKLYERLITSDNVDLLVSTIGSAQAATATAMLGAIQNPTTVTRSISGPETMKYR